MFNLAFFGFLRVSEFTTNSKFIPAIHSTFSDLQVVNHDIIHLNIKTSKTQLKWGHSIFIFNLPTPLQPFQSIDLFLHQRKSQMTSPLNPLLFIDDKNIPASRHWFQKNLKIILNRSGIPTKHFSSHSFHIGADTTVAQRGISEHQIKMLGLWTSYTFESYVRVDLHHIRQAHQSLAPFGVRTTSPNLYSIRYFTDFS